MKSNSIVFGNISLNILAEGVLKCAKNAEELIQIGEMVTKHFGKNRAFIYYVTAYEEATKAKWLTMRAFFPPTTNQLKSQLSKEFNKKFKSHRYKQINAYIDLLYEPNDILTLMQKKKEKINDVFKNESQNAQVFYDQLKEARETSLYVNFSNGKFESPQERTQTNNITDEKMDEFIDMVKKRVKEVTVNFPNEEKFIELTLNFHSEFGITHTDLRGLNIGKLLNVVKKLGK